MVHSNQPVGEADVVVREVGATGVSEELDAVVHASHAVSAGVVVVREVGATGVGEAVVVHSTHPAAEEVV